MMAALPATPPSPGNFPRQGQGVIRALKRIRLLVTVPYTLWPVLLALVPLLDPLFSADHRFQLQLANLEPWHYPVAAFEREALGYVVQRTLDQGYRPQSIRERRRIIRTYMQYQAQTTEATRRYVASAQLLDPLDRLRMEQAREDLRQAWAKQGRLYPELERAVQAEVADELARMDITERRRTLPPVLFRFASSPLLLTFSPRGEIYPLASVFLHISTPLAEIEAYEAFTLTDMDLSSYIGPTGGVATFPTTVQARIQSLEYLFDVVAHEWLHTYLLFHPLGRRYLMSTSHRTLNETAATLFGEEVARRIMLRFYADLLPAPRPEPESTESTAEEETDRVSGFRQAMHETRLTAEQLLAEGRITEAEAYMEARRLEINRKYGSRIRRLNQAFFAFHGTYATVPGSISPIGAQMTELRRLVPGMSDFIRIVQDLKSETDLQMALEEARIRYPEAATQEQEAAISTDTGPRS